MNVEQVRRIERGEKWEQWIIDAEDVEGPETQIEVFGEPTDSETFTRIHVTTRRGEEEWENLAEDILRLLGITGEWYMDIDETRNMASLSGER